MPYWFIVTWKPKPRVSHPNLPSRVKSHMKRKNVKLGFLTFPIMADLLSLTKQIPTRLLSCKCFRPRLARTWPTTAQTLSRITMIGDNITENPSLCSLGMIWKYVTEANSDTMSSRMIARCLNFFSRFFSGFLQFFLFSMNDLNGVPRYSVSKIPSLKGYPSWTLPCETLATPGKNSKLNWDPFVSTEQNVPNFNVNFTANCEIITTA